MTTSKNPPPKPRSRARVARWALVLYGITLGACLVAASSEPAQPASRTEIENSIGMRLVMVPAGTFTMGSPADEPDRMQNEGPAHQVRIERPFYLGATEVTVAQFAAFVTATGHRTEAEFDGSGGFGIDFETGEVLQRRDITWRAPGFPEFEPGPDHPAVLLSWEDAEAFCRWLSEKEKRVYRLPTEAEWEYAARAGSQSAFAHGNDPEALRRTANVADASLRAVAGAVTWAQAWDDGFPFLAPVASFEPNAFGLYDMHGNVWEWCADWYRRGYYAQSPVVDPLGPTWGSFRAIRGGGWFNRAGRNRSAQRVYFDPRFRYCLLSGFRVLVELERPRS